MTATMTALPVATPVAQTPSAPVRHSPFGYVGHDVSALKDVESILKACSADFTVYTAEGTVECLDGVTRPNETLSVIRDDTHGIVGTHKLTYHPIQYRTVLDIALEAVGLAATGAAIDTAGPLREGRQFYAAIDLGTLTLDPTGVADKIKRFLLLFASHDGTLPIMFVPRMERIRCKNELPAIRREARSGGFVAKHTKNVLDRLKMARDGLGIADAAEKAFVEQAERMLQIPATHTSVERIAKAVYGEPGDSEKSKTQHATRLTTLHNTFDSGLNSAAVGSNMWAVYNTITEYEDHLRGKNAGARALTSIIPKGAVEARKLQALNLCLN